MKLLVEEERIDAADCQRYSYINRYRFTSILKRTFLGISPQQKRANMYYAENEKERKGNTQIALSRYDYLSIIIFKTSYVDNKARESP